MSDPNPELAFLEALKEVGAGKLPPSAPLESDALQIIEGAALAKDEHTSTVPAAPATVTAKNFWQHPDTHPIVLDLRILNKYGPEWLEWEAETLRRRIPEDFGVSSVSELAISKLQACRALHLVDAFWRRWEVFIACAMPFNNEFPDFRIMVVPTVAQCLVAADIAARIRSDVEWSGEMKAYFSVVYQHDGIFLPLPPLDFVELEVPEEINKEEMVKRWPEVRASGKVPAKDEFVDVQLHRLLVVHEHLEESRTRLQQQLRLLHA